MTRGVVARVFRCHPEGGHGQLSDESAVVERLTPEEVTASMAEVYPLRIHDALRNACAPSIRTHDEQVILDLDRPAS